MRTPHRRRTWLALALAPALSAIAVLWPATAQAAVVERARNCVGDQVIRCGWINYDTTNQRLRGYASVEDPLDGVAFNVAVNNIRIQIRYSQSDPWETLDLGERGGDYDGWHPTSEEGSTDLAWCDNRYHRVIFHWQADQEPFADSSDASGTGTSDSFFC